MLNVITAAASSDLTTRAMVKAELGITGGGDDAWLDTTITRASAAIARWCNRTFALETVRDTFRLDRYLPDLSLSRFPVVSIASVTVAGTALDPAADYEAGADNGLLYRIDSRGKFMCWPSEVVVVEYDAGFVLPGQQGRTLPPDVEQATILLVKETWFARGRDPLVKMEDIAGIGRTDLWVGPRGDDDMPPDIAGLLSRHRMPAMG